MKYKTLFRVALKVVGVYLVLTGFAGMVSFGWNMFSSSSVRIANAYLLWIGTAVYQATYFGAGLYLFFGGKWLADLAIPGNRPYCHECGYDLTGAVGDRCNECGTSIDPKMLKPMSDNPLG